MTKKLISSTEPQGANPAFRLYENDGVNPEVYIDGMHGIAVMGAVVKMNCFTRGYIEPAQQTDGVEDRIVACRLVMGLDTFFGVINLVKNMEELLKSKGISAGETGASDA
jgi:hypothetical protein